ncbi:ABC transporter ATP-binding protein [Staphylococcus phage JPL-50]|uniref:ABC transporter ATP-binding protein n=1 Tax=Staphylococcus phage JPL-50 TaxID=2851077 RepID=A0A8F3C9Q1_9CAUD|nr:ABC transporter ATP-binding protein [Staphylococcus phage JPL-50]QWY14513.1 ABC transporter ATP-binding protein [Staphylococcus phage JPL-50]
MKLSSISLSVKYWNGTNKLYNERDVTNVENKILRSVFL